MSSISKKGNDQTRLKKNIALSTAYQVLAVLIPFITAPYVSRILGVNNIGIYSYTNSHVQFFMLFGALGTLSYGSREISRNREDKFKRSQLFWEIAILTVITSLIVIGVWLAWICFHPDSRLLYLIWTISLLGTLFDISWLYSGLEQFRHTVTQNVIFKLLGMLATFIFVNSADDLWIYVLIIAATQMLANLSMWVYLPKYVIAIPIKQLHILPHFKETLVYFIPTIAVSIYTILDKVLIGAITHDNCENGNYEQATKIITIAKSMAFVGVNLVLQSRISYLFVLENYEEIKKQIHKSIDYMVFISVGIMFGIIGIANRFVPLYYGAGYEKTSTLLMVMAPIVLIVSISNCLGSQYYNPAGLRSKSAKYIIIGSMVNLVLNLLFIPRYKSVGAVIASIIAEVLITSLYMINVNGYYSFKELSKVLWKKLIAGVIMMCAVFYLGELIQSGIVSVVVQVTVGVAVYSLILILLKDSFVTDFVLRKSKLLDK
ncbi:Membrane protein involved in the export of O-antigen and teichoic acid [Oscillospiraceae bacterium]|nr:Membrane protein involved in the export of O-antigen and teichoic acid [Oscillospiraceae bacterium]